MIQLILYDMKSHSKKVIFVLGFLLVQIMYANASYLKPSIIKGTHIYITEF